MGISGKHCSTKNPCPTVPWSIVIIFPQNEKGRLQCPASCLMGKLTAGWNDLFKEIILHLIPRNRLETQNNNFQALWHLATLRENMA